MKRRALLICFAVCLLSFLVAPVFAHPGRTDSNGGHTDSSTGEYHYHHGYSAHDHYDMDGDGVVDCPYDFDDKTNHDGGGGYGYTRPAEKVEQETEEVKKETEETSPEVKKENKEAVKEQNKFTKKTAEEIFSMINNAIVLVLGIVAFFLLLINA